MKVFKGPAQGQSSQIEISETQRDRVLVGLSWDMKELEKVEIPVAEWVPFKKYLQAAADWADDSVHAFRTMNYMPKTVNQHDDPDHRDKEFEGFDLDLYCYIFDEHGEMVEKIGPDYKDVVSEDGKVYHSGDDFSGIGGYDDEQIYIETKKLPENYKHFLFVVKSDCKFNLNDISDPVVRIADGKTNEDFLKEDIQPAANISASALIFAHMAEVNDSWTITNISEFADADYDIAAYFKENLK
ncbi:MAG: TerD family protein [Alphaproteobacteria bacterium]|nr:TerD family protein [Alphaproteobacteria bacterium]